MVPFEEKPQLRWPRVIVVEFRGPMVLADLSRMIAFLTCDDSTKGARRGVCS